MADTQIKFMMVVIWTTYLAFAICRIRLLFMAPANYEPDPKIKQAKICGKNVIILYWVGIKKKEQ